MSIRLNCETTFDCAHSLPYHEGKCSNYHGHTYRLRVTVEDYNGCIEKNSRGVHSYVNPDESAYLTEYQLHSPRTGMVMDFADLKAEVNSVVEMLDHGNLNAYIENPTAENLVLYIADKLSTLLRTHHAVQLVELKLWETPNNWVTWTNNGEC